MRIRCVIAFSLAAASIACASPEPVLGPGETAEAAATAPAPPPPSRTPGPATSLDGLFDAAAKDSSKVVEAIERGSAEISKNPAAAQSLAEKLEPLCRRAYFGPEKLAGMERIGLAMHVVVKDEFPVKIAKRYRFDAALLPLLNQGFDERKLQIGQRLKVIDLASGPLEIDVHKAQHRVALWRKGKDARILVGYWPCGTGKPGSDTPTGTTKVVKRARDPSWRHPDTGKLYAANDPENVLGGYWIGLDKEGIGREGIGFHGYTGKPPSDWIEKDDSHGCVRLLQEHVALLYDVALEGIVVTIGP